MQREINAAKNLGRLALHFLSFTSPHVIAADSVDRHQALTPPLHCSSSREGRLVISWLELMVK
jgi:hypothetical protein